MNRNCRNRVKEIVDKKILAALPPDKTIVACCRGPYCVYADEALAELAQAGWQVVRLEEGVLEWQEVGYAAV